MNFSRVQPFRIVTIGDSSVGKTSILTQLSCSHFDPDVTTTVAAQFIHLTKEVEGEDFELQIWDTAGAERFRALGPIYYRNAVGALVIFDLSSQVSFDNLPSWISSFLGSAEKDPAIVVLGNKADLTDKLTVSEITAKEWARSNGYGYFSTSAVTGIGIQDAILNLAKRLHADKRKCSDEVTIQPELVDLDPTAPESPSCDC